MDYTIVLIGITIILLSLCCAVLGSFMLLQRQSLLADTLSHCALAGITMACLLTNSYNPYILLCGACISSIISLVGIRIIEHYTFHNTDTALGIILSSFFGLGIVCITIIQKQSSACLAHIHKFLFGNISTVLFDDLYLISIVASVVLGICIICWKEFCAVTFDPMSGHMIARLRYAQLLLMSLCLVTIVVGISIVGAVLMSSLLIAPAAAAKQWAYSTKTMVIIATGCGLFASALGIYMSITYDHVPTGPAIVIALSTCIITSLLTARK